MTEALKKDYEKTCQERIDEQWQQRQKDLRNNEFEPLGFDYVEPHTFTDQLEGYWRWQFSWGGPSDELRGYVNENKRATSPRVLVLGLDGRCEAGAAARVRVGTDAGNGALRIMNWLIVSGLLLLVAASPLGMLVVKALSLLV